MAFSLRNAISERNPSSTSTAVLEFQAYVERLPNADYGKLSSVLMAARKRDYTFSQLVSMYNR